LERSAVAFDVWSKAKLSLLNSSLADPPVVPRARPGRVNVEAGLLNASRNLDILLDLKLIWLSAARGSRKLLRFLNAAASGPHERWPRVASA
jgi:hypothetical protein